MRWLLLLLTMVSLQANARVQLQSVYFIGESTNFTEYSSFLLERLKSSFSKGDYQIIEVNAFCVSGSNSTQNKSISKARSAKVLEKLNADSTDASINIYGDQQVAVNFKPVHWNRVDIYYTILELWKDQESPLAEENDHKEMSDSAALLIHTPPSDAEPPITFVEIPKHEKIPLNTPITLPMYFKGGKKILKKESTPVLDQLYRTMIAYPELKAHFRGHVCCGDNKRISRKRARYVYTYLRKRGVAKDRISYKGYSNSIPIVVPERTAADRAKNRRVDVVYSK